jgi:hypothetical protein
MAARLVVVAAVPPLAAQTPAEVQLCERQLDSARWPAARAQAQSVALQRRDTAAALREYESMAVQFPDRRWPTRPGGSGRATTGAGSATRHAPNTRRRSGSTPSSTARSRRSRS